MEWHIGIICCPSHQKQFKVQTYPGKVMASFFQESEEIFVVEFMEEGDTIPGP
jgi:hypothetical protein